jgi:hypothetical protein
MSGPKFGDVDIVKELRLRRWARENFLPAADRPSSWHPVVLDEMSVMDAEASEFQPRAVPYVPLAPSAVHLAHAALMGRSGQEMVRRSEECEVYFHG